MLLLHIKRKVTNRNLKIFQNTVAAGEELSPRDLFYYANESTDNQNMMMQFFYMKHFLIKTKDGMKRKFMHVVS